uniref:Putative reverse transcriptase RNA-dependent DNA polymerase n=1 Tax=Moniliophthora roreri TaxID=221103 RepID=A0A0W0EVG4_MONRR
MASALSTDNKKWMAACHDELKSLQEHNVYELLDLPQDGCYKAQLVAKDSSQVEGIDYDKLFSPVVHFETMHILLALATIEDWDIQALDVKTAFLYGKLDKEIYMEQPHISKSNT